MGVTHLWRLLEKAERPLSLEDLRGTVVAVDVSIWIHQLLHGVKGKDAGQSAYLIGIFNRICSLLHHRIRPIFVFDGNAPQLKKRALVDRRKRREENEEVSGQARTRLMAMHIKALLEGKQAALPEGGAGHAASPGGSQGSHESEGYRHRKPVPRPYDVDFFALPLPRIASSSGAGESRKRSPPAVTRPAKSTRALGTAAAAAAAVADLSGEPAVEELTDTEDEDGGGEGQHGMASSAQGYELPADTDTIFTADFDALPLRMQSEMLEEMLAKQKKGSFRPTAKSSEDFSRQQVAAVVKRNLVLRKLEAVREAILRENSAGGLAMRPLAADERVLYMFERGDSKERGPEDESQLLPLEQPRKQSPLSAEPKKAEANADFLSRREALLKRTSTAMSATATTPRLSSATAKSAAATSALATAISTPSQSATATAHKGTHADGVGNTSAGEESDESLSFDEDDILGSPERKAKLISLEPPSSLRKSREARSATAVAGERWPSAAVVIDMDYRDVDADDHDGDGDGDDVMEVQEVEQLPHGQTKKESAIHLAEAVSVEPAVHHQEPVSRQHSSKDAAKSSSEPLLSDEQIKTVSLPTGTAASISLSPAKSGDHVTLRTKVAEPNAFPVAAYSYSTKNQESLPDSLEALSAVEPTKVYAHASSTLSVATSEASCFSKTLSPIATNIPISSSTTFVTDTATATATAATATAAAAAASSALELDEDDDDDMIEVTVASVAAPAKVEVVASNEDEDCISLAPPLIGAASQNASAGDVFGSEGGNGSVAVFEVDSGGEASDWEPIPPEALGPPPRRTSPSILLDVNASPTGSPVHMSSDTAAASDSKVHGAPSSPPSESPEPPPIAAAHVPREVHPLVEALGEDAEALGNLADRTARAAAGLNTDNVSEVQELLRCFGMPFMIAPREAESQCAAFEQCGIASAIITDDSDVFLFGGRRVLRNVFTRNKDSGSVDMDDVESLLGLDRQALIRLALLMGCDYTAGVGGVGPVHAQAILHAFPGDTCLNDFKEWVLNGMEEREGLSLSFRTSVSLPANFPDKQIIAAFAEPINDPCPPCTWGVPDLSALRQFASEKFGWEWKRVDDLVIPLMRAPSPASRQLRLPFKPLLKVRTTSHSANKRKKDEENRRKAEMTKGKKRRVRRETR